MAGPIFLTDRVQPISAERPLTMRQDLALSRILSALNELRPKFEARELAKQERRDDRGRYRRA